MLVLFFGIKCYIQYHLIVPYLFTRKTWSNFILQIISSQQICLSVLPCVILVPIYWLLCVCVVIQFFSIFCRFIFLLSTFFFSIFFFFPTFFLNSLHFNKDNLYTKYGAHTPAQVSRSLCHWVTTHTSICGICCYLPTCSVISIGLDIVLYIHVVNGNKELFYSILFYSINTSHSPFFSIQDTWFNK